MAESIKPSLEVKVSNPRLKEKHSLITAAVDAWVNHQLYHLVYIYMIDILYKLFLYIPLISPPSWILITNSYLSAPTPIRLYFLLRDTFWQSLSYEFSGFIATFICCQTTVGVVDVNNLKNGKEASEVTEGKSSRMRWGR